MLNSAIAKIDAFLHRWFDGFRFKEFAAIVTAACAAGVALGMALGLAPERAQWFGWLAAAGNAWSYIRNPKAKEWKEDAPTSDSAE